MDQRVSAPEQTVEPVASRRPIGLAARVLALIVVVAILADIAILVPLIANFRNNWLLNRLAAAYTAALVLDAAPDTGMPDPLKMALLDSVGARLIVLKTADSRRMLAVSEMPPEIDEMDDLRVFSAAGSIGAAFRTLLAPPGRLLDIRGAAPMGAEFVEIVMDEAPLKTALHAYSLNLLLLSLAISLFVAALALIALSITVLAPVRRLTSNVLDFAGDPQDRARIIAPSGRTHEIGQAEHALADMQRALSSELREKKRLAELGLAVAKINHDLRNMLGSAQLLSDRMVAAADPLVARNAPKLVATLDRAIRFCQTTLAYGRSVDEAPHLQAVDLRPIAADALESAVASARTPIATHVDLPASLQARVDAEQMFRVLHNLCRNAVEALDAQDAADARVAAILLDGSRDGTDVVLRVCDSGPGLPAHTRDNLFVAFQGATRPGGTGLGLAIAADLVRAHGGTIRLLAPTAEWPGARFEIRLPAGT